MRQLAIDNPADCKVSPERMADLLSRNVTNAIFGTNHSSMHEVIARVEEKRRRGASALSLFNKTAEDQVLVTNALPTIMNKTTMQKLNTKQPPIGTIKTGPSLEGKKAKLSHRIEPEPEDPTL